MSGRRWGAVFVVLSGGLLVGCAQPQSNKFVAADYVGRARNIAVAAYMSSDRVAADADLFNSALGKRLGNCGVQSSFVRRAANYGYTNEARPYPDAMALADVATAAAEAVLIVAETKQHLMIQNFRTQEIGREYRLRYYDMEQRRVVWSTDVYMSGTTVLRVLPAGEKSQRLADTVADALVADGVLKGCPAVASGQ